MYKMQALGVVTMVVYQYILLELCLGNVLRRRLLFISVHLLLDLLCY